MASKKIQKNHKKQNFLELPRSNLLKFLGNHLQKIALKKTKSRWNKSILIWMKKEKNI